MPRTFADFFRFLFRARSRTLARPCIRTYRDAQCAYQRLPSLRAMNVDLCIATTSSISLCSAGGSEVPP